MERSERHAEAREALDGVARMRDKVAERVPSPWWYHPGMGLSMGIGVGMASFYWDMIPYGVIVGFLLVPGALSAVVDRRAGMSINRYGATPAARRESGGYGLAMVVVILAGILLQWPAGLPWAMAVSGVLVFALTVFCGRRIENAALGEFRRDA